MIGITGATPQADSVYDPTCGSGSLLLKASLDVEPHYKMIAKYSSGDWWPGFLTIN